MGCLATKTGSKTCSSGFSSSGVIRKSPHREDLPPCWAALGAAVAGRAAMTRRRAVSRRSAVSDPRADRPGGLDPFGQFGGEFRDQGSPAWNASGPCPFCPGAGGTGTGKGRPGAPCGAGTRSNSTRAWSGGPWHTGRVQEASGSRHPRGYGAAMSGSAPRTSGSRLGQRPPWRLRPRRQSLQRSVRVRGRDRRSGGTGRAWIRRARLFSSFRPSPDGDGGSSAFVFFRK
jgi:hypothetical protein